MHFSTKAFTSAPHEVKLSSKAISLLFFTHRIPLSYNNLRSRRNGFPLFRRGSSAALSMAENHEPRSIPAKGDYCCEPIRLPPAHRFFPATRNVAGRPGGIRQRNRSFRHYDYRPPRSQISPRSGPLRPGHSCLSEGGLSSCREVQLPLPSRFSSGVEVGLKEECVEEHTRIMSETPFDFVIGSIHEVGGSDPYYPDFYEGKTVADAKINS